MRAFAILGFFCASAWCDAQSPTADTTYRILTYGLPRFEYQNATWVVGQQWGIQHRAVAGCIVSRELVDSVKKENDRVFAAIERRFGAGWAERFEADVQREYEREQALLVPIKQLPAIVARQQALEAEGNGLHYWVTTGAAGDTVAVYGYGPWEGKTEWLLLSTYAVDGTTGNISLVSDTPRKE